MYFSRPPIFKAQGFCRPVRQIQNPSFYIRATVIYCNNYRPVVFKIRHTDPGPQRQCFMSCRKGIHIKNFPICRHFPVKILSIPGTESDPAPLITEFRIFIHRNLPGWPGLYGFFGVPRNSLIAIPGR